MQINKIPLWAGCHGCVVCSHALWNSRVAWPCAVAGPWSLRTKFDWKAYSKIHLWAALVLAVLAVGTVQARDSRIDAVEQLLMARWDTIPEDIVVEIVVDPTTGQSERYDVLRFFLGKQKAVARHREYVQQNYLPRLERMFREMPGEDGRSCRLILQAMASLRQERDQGKASTVEFLSQQAGDEALAEHKRAICRSLLDQMRGRSAAATSPEWQTEDRKIAGLVAKGAAGEAYKAALATLRADKQPVWDRLGALEWLDQMLACPTGVSFEQTRKDLTAVCSSAAEPILVKALVASILRAAFLEEMDSEHVVDVLKGLAQQASVREAAEEELAQLEAQRRSWQVNLQEHLQQVDRLVQQANLDASARQEYRELIEDPDYYAHPVGESPRWWVLGKFLQRQKATQASIEAFRRYLQTREPTAHVDDSLREAVKILAEQRAATGQEPLAYWMDIARQSRAQGTKAFVKALVETLSQPADRRVLVQFALSALQQAEQPDLAAAVLEAIVLSTQDVAGLEASGPREPYGRTAIAAALAREGKAAKAADYVDLTLADPLPTVPLFRAVGVADALFAAGKPEAGEALVRALMRRPGATSQRPNLLVYLMNQRLKAGQTAEAIAVQDELSQGYGLDSPETVAEALGKCIAVVRDKNPQAEIASTRLLCEILNGDTYPGLREEGAGSKEAVTFWRVALEWSQDHEETAGLEEFVRREPESKETDLARVLLARCALEAGRRGAAAEWLKGVGKTSAVSTLAGQEQRRLDGLQDRDRALRAELDAVRSQFADADVRAECDTILAVVNGGSPPAPPAQDPTLQVREGPDGEAYADAMHRIGLALRTAGRYQLAVGCFHKGFVAAPYAKVSADLLKEEAWTLRFCLGSLDESEVRLKQLVAIYPHHATTQWARFYLSIQANLLHPE